MRWDIDGTFWLTVLALVGSTVGFIYGPIIMTQVQAEQIATIKQEQTTLKETLPRIERSLGRIEGKLGIGN